MPPVFLSFSATILTNLLSSRMPNLFPYSSLSLLFSPPASSSPSHLLLLLQPLFCLLPTIFYLSFLNSLQFSCLQTPPHIPLLHALCLAWQEVPIYQPASLFNLPQYHLHTVHSTPHHSSPSLTPGYSLPASPPSPLRIILYSNGDRARTPLP